MPSWLQKLTGHKNFVILAGIGGAAALVLAGGLMMALRRNSRKKTDCGRDGARTGSGGRSTKRSRPTPQEIEQQLQEHLAEQSAEKARQEAETLMKLKLPAVSTKKAEVLAKHIVAEAKKDPTAMAQVVRTWLRGQR